MVKDQQTFVKGDYYSGSRNRKIIDFCIGFFGAIILFVICVYLTFWFLFSWILRDYNFAGNATIFGIIQIPIVVFILVQIVLFKIFRRKNREYIKYGALFPIILLSVLGFAILTFLGSCAFSPPSW